MFIYHRNVCVSIVAIIRKRNNDALTNNIYSFFLKYIQTNRQTDRHTFAFIYKKDYRYSQWRLSKGILPSVLIRLGNVWCEVVKALTRTVDTDDDEAWLLILMLTLEP
jgi:hypothetical protein